MRGGSALAAGDRTGADASDPPDWKNVSNSTLLDRDALARLGTAAARRELPNSGRPIWVCVGPETSGLRLGYRAAEAGVWLAELAFEGERFEALLGPADDKDAPPKR